MTVSVSWWQLRLVAAEDGDGLGLGVGVFDGCFCGSWFRVFGWGGGLGLGWCGSRPGVVWIEEGGGVVWVTGEEKGRKKEK